MHMCAEPSCDGERHVGLLASHQRDSGGSPCDRGDGSRRRGAPDVRASAAGAPRAPR